MAERVADEGAARVDALTDDDLADCLDYAANALAAAEIRLDRLEAAGAHSERALAIAIATGRDSALPVLFWTGHVRTVRGHLAVRRRTARGRGGDRARERARRGAGVEPAGPFGDRHRRR